MGKGQGWLVSALLIALLGITVFSVFKPTGTAVLTRPKWEYKVDAVADSEFDKGMATIGADGWELVFARRANAGEGHDSKMLYECIFMRPQ